jgi:hypothetical protein
MNAAVRLKRAIRITGDAAPRPRQGAEELGTEHSARGR